MNNEIKVMSEEIRVASRNISNIAVSFSSKNKTISLEKSNGLVVEGINKIIANIEEINDLIEKILQEFPVKLENVARIIEDSDNISAEQFK